MQRSPSEHWPNWLILHPKIQILVAFQLYLENAKKHHRTLAKFINISSKFLWPYVSLEQLAKNHSDLKLRIQIQNCKINAKKHHRTVTKLKKFSSKNSNPALMALSATSCIIINQESPWSKIENSKCQEAVLTSTWFEMPSKIQVEIRMIISDMCNN